jgi:hypothetical protein
MPAEAIGLKIYLGAHARSCRVPLVQICDRFGWSAKTALKWLAVLIDRGDAHHVQHRRGNGRFGHGSYAAGPARSAQQETGHAAAGRAAAGHAKPERLRKTKKDVRPNSTKDQTQRSGAARASAAPAGARSEGDEFDKRGGGLGVQPPPISKQTLAALLEIDRSPRWAARVGRWLRELVDQTSPAIVEASIATGLEALAAGRLTSDLLAYIAQVARNRHNGRASGNTSRREVRSLGETLPTIKLSPVKTSEALRSLLQLRPF